MLSTGLPSSALTIFFASAVGKGSKESCKTFSSLAKSAPTMSGLVDNNCPNFMYAGPNATRALTIGDFLYGPLIPKTRKGNPMNKIKNFNCFEAFVTLKICSIAPVLKKVPITLINLKGLWNHFIRFSNHCAWQLLLVLNFGI